MTAVAAIVAVGCTSSRGGGQREPESARERLVAGETLVEVGVEPDLHQYEACITGVRGVEWDDAPLCVGPHDGQPGATHSWSRADRVGTELLFLAIMGTGDTMTGVPLSIVASSRFPVTVAVGVLADDGSGVVCTEHVSGDRRTPISTAVSSLADDRFTALDDLTCDA